MGAEEPLRDERKNKMDKVEWELKVACACHKRQGGNSFNLSIECTEII